VRCERARATGGSGGNRKHNLGTAGRNAHHAHIALAAALRANMAAQSLHRRSYMP